MEETKKVFKIFTITQYREEEDFLSEMHAQGWKFVSVSYPGFYRFEKCQPEQVSYRLDYNSEGLSHKDEYVRMFSDCGWEYIMDFVGYSYFRKPGQTSDEREEIFCDDESRLDMMRRVYRSRMFPVFITFFLVVVPQLFVNVFIRSRYSLAQETLTYVLAVLALVYLAVFATMSVHFYKYEKRLSSDTSKVNLKYTGILALIAVMAVGIGVVMFKPFHSDYRVTETSHGYVIEAHDLNSSVMREYDLETGDTVTFNIKNETGHIYLNLAADGSDPVFFADFYDTGATGEYPIEIMERGHYTIEVKGKHVKDGSIEVVIGR